MRKFFDHGDGGDIERVARVGFEGADAALAEDDVVVAAGQDVLGAEEKLFHGGGHAALEEHGLADLAERAEEVVVLHVARADLEDIDVAEHHLHLRRVHNFADGEEIEFLRGFAHQLEALFAHALEGVGRSARLESAGAKDFGSGFGDGFGDGKDLLARLDGARTGSDYDLIAADFYAAAEIDDGAFGLELAAGKLEGLGDAHDFAHAIEELEIAMIEIAVDADGAEDGVGFAGGAMHVEAAGDEAIDDVLDLGVGGAFLHYDDHVRCLVPFHRSKDRPLQKLRPAGLKPGLYRSSPLPAHGGRAESGRYNFSSLSTTSPKCMAWRSALRASSMMRSKRRRMAASVSGPEFAASAFSRTSRSRSG